MRSMMVRVCAGLVLAAAGAMAALAQSAPDAGGKTTATASETRPEQATASEGRRERSGVNPDATVRVFVVKNTRAGELHRILDSVMPALGPMRVTTDDRSNTLIVAGDEKAVLPKVEALLAALDRPLATEGQPTEAVVNVPLNDARAKPVATALERLLSEPMQRGPGGPPPTRVVADESGNSIWLAGEKSRVEQYAEHARQMDKGAAARPNPRRELRYYTLKNAEAQRLGQTVSQTSMVMGLEVPIVADGASDTLIAFGTKEEHEIIANLVSRLDVAPRHAGRMVEEAAPDSKKAEPRKPEPKP